MECEIPHAHVGRARAMVCLGARAYQLHAHFLQHRALPSSLWVPGAQVWLRAYSRCVRPVTGQSWWQHPIESLAFTQVLTANVLPFQALCSCFSPASISSLALKKLCLPPSQGRSAHTAAVLCRAGRSGAQHAQHNWADERHAKQNCVQSTERLAPVKQSVCCTSGMSWNDTRSSMCCAYIARNYGSIDREMLLWVSR